MTEGDSADSMYIIVDGKVDVYRNIQTKELNEDKKPGQPSYIIKTKNELVAQLGNNQSFG